MTNAKHRDIAAVVATAGLTAALTVVVAAPAAASTVSATSPGVLQYVAGDGEENDVTIVRSGASLVISDAPGIVIAPSGTCTFGGGVATCPAAGVTSVMVDLGDLDDRLVVDPSVTLAAFVVGGIGDDEITTSSGNDAVFGDTFDLGGDGADVIRTGPGNDHLQAWQGDNELFGGAGNDRLIGGTDRDQLEGGTGDDLLDPNRGTADTVVGGAGRDKVSYDSHPGPVSVSLNGVADDGASGELQNVAADVEDVVGTFQDDVLVGSSARNTIDGGRGNDTISGGGGPDRLVGGAGDNGLSGGAGDDVLDGSVAYTDDAFDGGDGDDSMVGDASSPETFIGGDDVDLVTYLRDGDVTVRMDDLANDGEPGEGDKVSSVEDIITGSGNDRVVASATANEIDTGRGNDVVDAGGGSDGVTGGAGRDQLTGGTGVDSLFGDGGADTLISQDTSSDYVSCGSSVDTADRDGQDQVLVDCERLT